jgi:hypothetical protein
MVRFVKDLGSYEYNVNVGMKDKEELKSEVYRFREGIKVLPDADAAKMSEYFRKMWLDVIGPGIARGEL